MAEAVPLSLLVVQLKGEKTLSDGGLEWPFETVANCNFCANALYVANETSEITIVDSSLDLSCSSMASLISAPLYESRSGTVR